MDALLHELEALRAPGLARAAVGSDGFAGLLAVVRSAAAEHWPALPGPAALQQLSWLLEDCREANVRLATWTGAGAGSLADAVRARDDAVAALSKEARR